MHIRRVIILVILLWMDAGGSPSAAQAPRHHLGLDLGIAREASLDELASPLIYRDVFPVRGITYAYRRTRSRHWASLAYGRPRMTSSISSGEDHVQKGWQIQFIERSVVRIASTGDGTVAAFAGVGIDGRFRRRLHSYGGRSSEWFTEGHGTLTVAGSVEYRSVLLDVAVPVFGYVIRSPYAVKGRLRSRWAIPIRGLSVRLGYERSWTRHAAVYAGYALEALRLEDPMQSSTLSHGLSIGLRWVP